MLSWRLRQTGIRYRPPTRIAVAAVLGIAWLAVGIWLTFAFDWQITNVWVHLGLYGHALPHARQVRFQRVFSYPPARVARVNHWIDKYGNMVLLTPLVVLLPLLWPPVRWWQVTLVGMLMSCGIEGTQWVVGGRVAQVSDVVVNTSGVLVAAVAMSLARAGYRRLQRPQSVPG